MSTKNFPSTGNQPSASDAEVMDFLRGGGKPKSKAVKSTTVKQSAEPIAASDEDVKNFLSGTLKKKDTESESSPTPSLSTSPSPDNILNAVDNLKNKKVTPEDLAVLQQTDFGKQNGLTSLTTPQQRDAYASAFNSPKTSELHAKVFDILNSAYPKSPDSRQNAKRIQIMQGVQSGDQDVIKNTRNGIVSDIQKQIDDTLKAEYKYTWDEIGGGYSLSDFGKQKVAALKDQQKQITDTFNDYAVNAMANSKEMTAQIKAEVSGKHYSIVPNVAAEDLGKAKEKIQGGIFNPSGNIQYARQAEGLKSIISAKQMNLNDLMLQALKTKDPALIKQVQQQQQEINIYQQWLTNLDDNFPDVKVTKVVRFIGDDIAENNPSNMVISKSDVEESARRINKKYPGFLDKYGKEIGVVAESEGSGLGMFKSGLVPKGGLTGGFGIGMAQVMLSGAETVADIFGDTKTAQFAKERESAVDMKGTKFSGETPTKIVYDNEGKALIEKPNEYYGKIDLNSFLKFIGQSLPNFAQWVVAERGGAALAEAAKLTKGAKGFAGLMAASYATSYDANRDYADSLIDDNTSMGQANKAAFANFLTLSLAGVYHMVGFSPTRFLENATTKSVGPDALELLKKNGWKIPPKTQVQEFLKDKVLPKVKAFGKDAISSIGEGAKVGAATVTDQKIKDFTSQVINPQSKTSDIDDNIKSFAQQTLFMSLLGMPKTVIEGFRSPSTKDAFYEIGTRAPQYIDMINAKLDRGEYTEDQANQMINTAKTMWEEVAKAQFETTKDRLPLTVGQKKEVALQNFRKRFAAGMEENGQDVPRGTIQKDADENIKNIKSQNTFLPVDETHAFKTAKEVDKEGNPTKTTIGGYEDIDPEKTYTWQDNDGKEVKGTGIKLITELQNSKAYEKKSDTGTGTTGEETETAVSKGEGAEVKEGAADKQKLIEEGNAAIDKAIAEKKLSNISATIAKENPEQFLKDVAMQSYGITTDVQNENRPVKSDLPAAEKSARGQFGDDVVDVAKKLYSEQEILSPKTDHNEKGSDEKNGQKENDQKGQHGDDRQRQEAEEGDEGLLKKQEGLGETGPSLKEVIGKPVTYKGEKAIVYQDGQTLVAKIDGSNKEYELGNVDEMGAKPVSDFGIEQPQSVVSVDNEGNFNVRGKVYTNPFEERGQNPLDAILYDKDGNIVNVRMKSDDGGRRTFTGDVAEDLAYQIHLKEITKDNETRESFEQFINNDAEAKKEFENSGLSEVAAEKQVENNAKVSEKSNQIKTNANEPSGQTTEPAPRAAQPANGTEQPPAGGAAENTERTVGANDRQGAGTQTRTGEESAEAYRASAERLRAEGDEVGAKKLEDAADKLENKPPGPPVTSQSADTEDRRITGIRNSVIDTERIHARVEPFLRIIRSRWSDLWSGVTKAVESGLLNPREFVKEQINKLTDIKSNGKLILTDYENAIMLYDRVKLLNDLKNNEDTLRDVTEKLKTDASDENKYASEKLKQDIRTINDQLRGGEFVLRKSGTHTAQALASRQMMADMFGKLVSWEDYIKQQYDGNPPPEMLRKARALQEMHQQIQTELNAHYESMLKKAGEDAYKKGFDDAKKQGLTRTTAAREKNKNLANKLRAAADKFEKFGRADLPEGTQIQGVDFQKLIADAMRHIADGIENNKGIGKLINEAVEKFKGSHDDEEFRNELKNSLQSAGIQSEQDKLLANIKDDAVAAKSTSIVKDSVTDIKKLMNGLIRDGEAASLSELTAKTKLLIKDIYPDATERELRDLYSGYGMKAESRSEVEKRLSDTKQQARLASELEDLLKPVSGETPLEEKARYDKINKILPQVEQYMKEQGMTIEVAPYNDSQRVQISLDNSTNRIKEFIDGLGNKISGESKDLRDRNEPVDDNPKVKELKEEQDFIKKRLDGIINTKLSDVQKIQRIDGLLRNQRSKLERKLREGSNPLLPYDKQMSSAEKLDLRDRIRNYNKQIGGLKDDLTPDAEKRNGALGTYNEKLSQGVARLEQKIKNKDFSDEPISDRAIIKDSKSAALETKLRTTQNDYWKLKRVVDEHGKSTYKKILDTFNNYIRFNVLSNYITLARLGSAVAENMVFTPAEQALGMGYTLASHVPFFGQPLRVLMSKADRHGALGVGDFYRSEGSAIRATFGAGIRDVWQELKHNNSELGILYGDESQMRGVPDEYKDTWYKINNALGVAARVHSAEKAFFKRNEFTRSYLLRKEAARKRGLNTNDPVLQQEMGLAAYNDAMTSILLGDNKFYDFYRDQIIGRLERSDNVYANGLRSFLTFMTPIVKVPTNLVLAGGRASFGWLAGAEIGVRAMVELVKPDSKFGIQRLTATESDALLRNLKKGTLGLGLITLGFFRPDMFGSSTFYKRGIEQEEDLEEGGAKFFGVTMPRWATDNPYFWAMKLGASARRFYDYYTKKGKPLTAAVTNTAIDVVVGGLSEIPLLGTWSETGQALRNPDANFAQNFLYNQLTKLSPASGLGGQLAKDVDRDEQGNVIKRTPTNIGEAFEMKIPGLRQNVPTSEDAKEIRALERQVQ